MAAANAGVDPLTALLHRAVAFHREGRLAHAEGLYEKILRQQPRHFDALHLLGVVAAQTNHPARALTLIGKAIEIDPRNADAFCNQGSAFKALEQFDAALHSYDQAIAIRPEYAEAHCCRSAVLRELRRWDEALRSSARAIELRPAYVEAYCNQGRVLTELGQFDVALLSYDRAIALDPNSAEAHNQKGLVLRKLGDRAAALSCFERALATNPHYAHAHLNRGNVLMDLYRLDEALASYGRAVDLKPDFAEARSNRAPIFLLRGDFTQGWSDHEWRWRVREASIERQRGNFPQPLWLGKKPVTGKTVLLLGVLGLGDTLQFCRYAPLVARLGAKVVLQVPRTLIGVLTSLDGVAAVYGDDDPLPSFDTYCRITSLPLAFQTTLTTIPAQIPYLRSDAAKTLHWRQKLGERRKPRVGLAWSSRFRPDEQEGWSVLNHRIVPLVELGTLEHAGIEFHSLQKGEPAESELAQLRAGHWPGPDLIDHSAQLHDFADTAALIDQLDLVISVDTSVAHLAAAMGKPVWILLCFDSCWRWLAERADSPWYPTARLYRQERPGEWAPVIDRVQRDLTEWIEESGSVRLTGES
jgi:tetratricopeptide (TPR) repeat protein